MPPVLAQSNLPKSAAVVVSSETIILRDPSNDVLEKYTSDEQRQKALKSYGIKPATLLSPGENKVKPIGPTPIFYDWIRDVDAAYIATGFIPKSTTKIQTEFKYIDGSYNYFFGVQSPDVVDSEISTQFGIILVPQSNNRFVARLYWGNDANSFTPTPTVTIDRVNLKVGGGFVQLNETTPVSITGYDPNIEASKELFIFATNRNIIANKQGNTYLFSFKIYDDSDNLLMSLRPATINEVPGLYDEVSGTFFENAADSGSFIVGNGETPSVSLLGGSFDPSSTNSDEEM